MNTEFLSLQAIILAQITRYPLMEIRDVYKLIYQGAMGGDHAVQDAQAVRVWFDQDVRDMVDGPEEPVVDPISVDKRVIRINLRPYKSAGGDLTALCEAFIRSAQAYQGNRADLVCYWAYVEQMSRAGLLCFELEALNAFIQDMVTKGFPAVHHSQVYEQSYHPAYRVILDEYLPRIPINS